MRRSTLVFLIPFLALSACRVDDRMEREALVGYYAPFVRSLSREVTVFNWAQRAGMGLPEAGEIAADDSRVTDYLKSTAEKFWKTDADLEGQLGNGLYAATDPVATMGFGHEHWALTTIELWKGFRFLDLRAEGKNWRVPEVIAKGLEAHGCDFIVNARSLFESTSRPCRAILNEVIAELHVSGMIYDYVSTPLPGCERNRTDAAFEIFDSTIAKAEHATFVREVPKPDAHASERELVAYLMQGHAQLWPEIDLQRVVPDRTYEERIFGCSGKFAEDADPAN